MLDAPDGKYNCPSRFPTAVHPLASCGFRTVTVARLLINQYNPSRITRNNTHLSKGTKSKQKETTAQISKPKRKNDPPVTPPILPELQRARLRALVRKIRPVDIAFGKIKA
jgi:hypothetical protein